MCLIAHHALLTANLITPFLQRTSYRVDRLLRRREILVKPIALIADNTHFETAWGPIAFGFADYCLSIKFILQQQLTTCSLLFVLTSKTWLLMT